MTWNFEATLNFHNGQSYDEFITEENMDKATPDAIDLLSKILVWDHVIAVFKLTFLD